LPTDCVKGYFSADGTATTDAGCVSCETALAGKYTTLGTKAAGTQEQACTSKCTRQPAQPGRPNRWICNNTASGCVFVCVSE